MQSPLHTVSHRHDSVPASAETCLTHGNFGKCRIDAEMAFKAILLLTALCIRSVRADMATATPVPVATAEEFSAAIAAGEEHIVVTQHLDLRELPRLGEGYDATLMVLASPTDLLSLRVRSCCIYMAYPGFW